MSDYYLEINERPPSQGDIVELAPHIRLAAPLRYLSTGSDSSPTIGSQPTGEAIAQARQQLALVLTHDCEIDKEKTHYWHICPIHPLSRVSRTDQSNIRKNKVLSHLFLPAYKTMPDSFADFGWITTVDAEIMKAAPRLMTLSDLTRAALYVQHLRWISRWVLDKVKCPNCNVEFNPSDTMPVRSAD